MNTALVTGGAGFIGSHLAVRLIREGWRVYIVDNLSTGFESNIPKGAEFIFLDISREDFTNSLPDVQMDAVFHFAAQSSGEISFDNPCYDLKTNCLSTLLLLEWSLKRNVKHFLFTSSMSIYGDQEVQPVREDAMPNPNSFYGVGKLASESYLNIYSKLGLKTTSLRLFNVYGPGQNMKNLRQGMVSIYMAYILQNREVIVKGAPDRYRDLIYIDDVVDAYCTALFNPAAFGKSFNVATGVKTTVQELIDMEISTFGFDPKSYPVSYTDGTPGDTFGIVADVAAIKNDIGWSAKVPIADGLERMIQWAKQQA